MARPASTGGGHGGRYPLWLPIRDPVRPVQGSCDERRSAGYVSALVQSAAKDPELSSGIYRIPGSDRARQAYARGEALTRGNFVKGQAVNGPTGAMERLARTLRLVDDESHLDSKGRELILAWAKDEGLAGILEGKSEAEEGRGADAPRARSSPRGFRHLRQPCSFTHLGSGPCLRQAEPGARLPVARDQYFPASARERDVEERALLVLEILARGGVGGASHRGGEWD